MTIHGQRIKWRTPAPDGTEVEVSGYIWSDGPAAGQVWAVRDGDRGHFTLLAEPNARRALEGDQVQAASHSVHATGCEPCTEWLAGQAAAAKKRRASTASRGRRGRRG